MATIAILGVLAFLASLQAKSGLATAIYTAPFVLLLAMTPIFKTTRSSGRAIAAAIGAAIPIAAFHCLFLHATWNYNGGGANMGLGLLFMLMPFIILIAMVAGWLLGGKSKNGSQTPD